MSNDEGMSNDERDALLREFSVKSVSRFFGVNPAALRVRNDEFRMTNDEGMPNDESRDAAEMEFWFGDPGVVREEPNDSSKFDLEERTARFGEAVIEFALSIPQNPVTSRLITQLVGAGTSIGANY